MNPSLENLRPLHDPAPISWWPPAPGWWLLLILLVGLFFLLRYRWNKKALQRAALSELKVLERDGAEHLPAEINRFLKRYALSCFPGEEVAALSGQTWLEFLEQHGGFSTQLGRVMLDTLYRSDPGNIDRKALIDVARRWVKKNKPVKH
jgi:hypothetical protein